MKVSIQAIGEGGEANSFARLNSMHMASEQFRLGIEELEKLDAVAIHTPRASPRAAIQIAEERALLKSFGRAFIE